MNDIITFINQTFEEFEADSKLKKWEIAKLKGTTNGFNVRLEKVDRALDCQEWHLRRNCLVIHSIDEEN